MIIIQMIVVDVADKYVATFYITVPKRFLNFNRYILAAYKRRLILFIS